MSADEIRKELEVWARAHGREFIGCAKGRSQGGKQG